MNTTPTKYFWKAPEVSDTQMLEIGTFRPNDTASTFELQLHHQRNITSLNAWITLFSAAGSKIYDEHGQRVTAGRMVDRISDCQVVNINN